MQQMAQGLASLGRGQDSMLVHMTPGEVHGLQSLAQQHGGSLTINPQTGLPEAGFLSSILPMVGAGIGIALAPATGGASMYAMGGGALGGMLGSSMEGKSVLMGGLMGGLSGYSMSGLMDSFASAASPSITAGMDARTAAAIQEQAATDMLAQRAASAPIPNVASAGFGATGATEMLPSTSALQSYGYADVLPSTSQSLASATVAPAPVVPDFVAPEVPYSTAPTLGPPTGSYMDKVSSGFSNTMDKPLMPFLKANAGKIAGVALPVGLAGIQAMSAQPTLPASMARPATPTMFDNRQYSPGTRNPNFGQPGQPYFLNQGFTPSALSTAYAAAGGSMQDIQANSRPILPPNQMIGGSTPNENEFYPGANIARGGASYASQSPSATDVVGGYDQNINQYTGEPVRMAGGGITYNQKDQTYSGEVQPYGSNYGSANLSDLFASTAFPKQLNFVLDEIGQGMRPQMQQQTAPQYNYNPDNQQYTQRMAKGGKAKALDTEINTDEPSERDIYENTDDDTIAKLQKVLGRSIAEKSMAGGGIASLNEYAAGGRLLQGPGDGMSDSIPAVIKGAKPQRAALAQGEFVIPADVVSHLGNGSTDAGSKRLYAMMDKIRHARTGSKKQGRQINPDKFMIA